tara:strand:+ start:7538 stop:7948 length:411 start_codon:yes stop_codon:yes gene_type:complete
MDFLTTWQEPLLWASGLSLLAAIATIVAIPWVVTRLPQDYFASEDRHAWRGTFDAPVLMLALGVIKNVFGLLLILAGLIMLVTPGQGVLTLLIGLLLMNFPGKYRVERWLVLQPGVLRGLNWLREKRGHAPFDTPH